MTKFIPFNDQDDNLAQLNTSIDDDNDIIVSDNTLRDYYESKNDNNTINDGDNKVNTVKQQYFVPWLSYNTYNRIKYYNDENPYSLPNIYNSFASFLNITYSQEETHTNEDLYETPILHYNSSQQTDESSHNSKQTSFSLIDSKWIMTEDDPTPVSNKNISSIELTETDMHDTWGNIKGIRREILKKTYFERTLWLYCILIRAFQEKGHFGNDVKDIWKKFLTQYKFGGFKSDYNRPFRFEQIIVPNKLLCPYCISPISSKNPLCFVCKKQRAEEKYILEICHYCKNNFVQNLKNAKSRYNYIELQLYYIEAYQKYTSSSKYKCANCDHQYCKKHYIQRCQPVVKKQPRLCQPCRKLYLKMKNKN